MSIIQDYINKAKALEKQSLPLFIIVMFVIVVIVGFLALMIIGGILMVVSPASMVSTSSTVPTPVSSGTTQAVQTTTKVTAVSTPTFARWGDFQLQESHWERGQYGNRYVSGTVKNTGSKTYSYVQVSVNLYDDSGAQVGSALANVNNLEAGGTWKFQAIVLEDAATNSKIKEITGF